MGKNLKMRQLKRLSSLLFFLYMLAVVYFMFLADSFHRTDFLEEYRYNLQLFQEMERFPSVWRVHGPWIALVNLIGNVAVFMPFGFFLPFHKRNLRNGIVVSCLAFLFSLLIETTQLIFKIGVFDVDDLFLNTVGGVLGYLTFFISFKLYLKYRRPRKQKMEK